MIHSPPNSLDRAVSTWDFDRAIRELRAELRAELREKVQEEVRRSKAQDSSLFDWTDMFPLLLPVVAAWLMVLVLLADRA